MSGSRHGLEDARAGAPRGRGLARLARRVRGRAACVLLLALLASAARAHEGPPYPVIVEESHGPWLLTVWADPDVGLGTFWVRLEHDDAHRAPDDTRVHVAVAPADGRLEPVRVPAERETWSAGQSHVAEVEFPTREFWTVRIELDSASAGAHAESVVNVEVTPPGYGTLDLLLYSWPFLALGLLWLKALRKQRAARRAASPTPSP